MRRRLVSLTVVLSLAFLPVLAAKEVLEGPLASAQHWVDISTPDILEELAERLIELDPIDSRGLARAGRLLLRAGRTEEAGRVFDRALASDLNDDEACLIIALAYSEMEMWDQADRWFQTAVDMDPNDPDHKVEWGVTYWNRGEKEKAARLFLEALTKEPKTKRLYYKIGRGLD